VLSNENSLNDGQRSINDMRIEVSPGKVGDGLFPPTMQNENSDGGLSSEEENLIAQSTFEISNILGDQAKPAFLSRFADMMGDSMHSDQEDSSS